MHLKEAFHIIRNKMGSLGLFLVLLRWNKMLHVSLHFCFDNLQNDIILVYDTRGRKRIEDKKDRDEH